MLFLADRHRIGTCINATSALQENAWYRYAPLPILEPTDDERIPERIEL